MAKNTPDRTGGDPFKDAIPTSKFMVEVDGVGLIGYFTEVSGLSLDCDVEEVEEGGENQFVHKLPGRLQWPNLTLKRGVTRSDNLFGWMAESGGEKFATNGDKLKRRTAAVVMLAPDGTRLRSWKLSEAFAVRWNGPSFAVSSTDAAVEELEIAHHGFKPS